MTIRVAIHHETRYAYDRRVNLFPQIIRLRPAPHARTPIPSYSLKVEPKDHFENWQQDPHGNFLARCVFPEPVTAMKITVDLVAEMTVINPFDFFVEPDAEEWPFRYEPWLQKDLRPFLECPPPRTRMRSWLERVDRTPRNTVDFLVELNQRLEDEINYLIRMEPGVQTPEETLTLNSGSCRDTSWLLVHILRHLGIAARFASGYLVQLAPDVKSLDGPSGPEKDFTDLHAWAEAYLPGAGWIGLDPTSGLLAGEGHIPVACTPEPASAAPITGSVGDCETEFSFDMSVTRIHEDPRVTKPYSDDEWNRINAVGLDVDDRLQRNDVRLTMGGEPTFVSVDDMDGAEWTTDAVGPTKRRLAATLLDKLRKRLAPGALMHFGQGKWYPGESLPRWAFSCYWRSDGEPVWKDLSLVAEEDKDYGHDADDAKRFVNTLADVLDVDSRYAVAAYEDAWHYLAKERRLPVNLEARNNKLEDPEERARLARVVEEGFGKVAGYVLPLRRQWWQTKAQWVSGPWPVRSDRMFVLPGDSPLGLRLPLDSLPWSPGISRSFIPDDPSAPKEPLPMHTGLRAQPGIVSRLQQRRQENRREQEVGGRSRSNGIVCRAT